MVPPPMAAAQTLYLCMGSSCYDSGSMTLRPEIADAIERHGLKGKVVLKGAFCLETCLGGLAIEFEEDVITGLTSENLDAIFVEKILPRIRPE